jgi:hypothetical protein
MSATFNWAISATEYGIQPADMDGAIIVAHWRCNATQTEGSGDDAVTYNATSYCAARFSPDPTSPDYTLYSDVTEQQVLDWCFAECVDKDATEASLQATIDAKINPTTSTGVPW